MSWPSLLKLDPRTTEKALSVVPHPLKLHAKRGKSSITQPRIIQFGPNFAECLNAWHPKKIKRLKAMVAAWTDVCKNTQIINNSAEYYARLRSNFVNFDHVTPDVSRTFQNAVDVHGLEVKGKGDSVR